jgi:hypothetical protein
MKKPQLKVGQHWIMSDGVIVRITGWGQDGGGRGEVHYVDIREPDDTYTQFGRSFRKEATPVLEISDNGGT